MTSKEKLKSEIERIEGYKSLKWFDLEFIKSSCKTLIEEVEYNGKEINKVHFSCYGDYYGNCIDLIFRVHTETTVHEKVFRYEYPVKNHSKEKHSIYSTTYPISKANCIQGDNDLKTWFFI